MQKRRTLIAPHYGWLIEIKKLISRYPVFRQYFFPTTLYSRMFSCIVKIKVRTDLFFISTIWFQVVCSTPVAGSFACCVFLTKQCCIKANFNFNIMLPPACAFSDNAAGTISSLPAPLIQPCFIYYGRQRHIFPVKETEFSEA